MPTMQKLVAPSHQPMRSLLPTPRPIPLPSRRVSVLHEGQHIRKRGLYLGTFPDGQSCYLKEEHLRTHLHLLGATGTEKSRLMLWLFKLLCHTRRPIIVADFKGGLVTMLRNWALANGYAKRLVLFDMCQDTLIGYNPLRENGLRIDLQSQWVAEGIKSAWGQATFDDTPQLARFLYLVLYVSRALKLSLVEGLDVLRPYPALRNRALMQITDPFVHGALRAFDALNDRRKEEVTASTLARLEAFCRDQVMRTVICSPQSLDLESALHGGRILLLNFAKYQPLLADPLKMLARMFMSDLLAHAFKGYGEGKFNENKPIYFMVDEVQNMATRQMCDALDEGRGIGLHCIISHQHMHQLADEDKSGYLYSSVMTDARTKLITGGLHPEDLKVFGEYLLMDHYDPWWVKYIQRSPVFAPVESRRLVRTASVSNALSKSATENISHAKSVSHSVHHSESHGSALAESIAFSEGGQESYTNGRNASTTKSHNWGAADTLSGASTRSTAHTTGTTVGRGHTHGSGNSYGATESSGRNSASGWSNNDGQQSTTSSGEGQTMLPPVEHIGYEDDPEVVGLSTHTSNSEGRSSSSGTNGMIGESTAIARSNMNSEMDSDSYSTAVSNSDTTGLSETEGWSHAEQEGFGVAQTEGENEAWSSGKNWSTSRGTTVTMSDQVSDGYSDTVGYTDTHGTALTEGETNTSGESVTETPFYEYRREVVLTPVFFTPEEQKLLQMQKLARIPERHVLVKTPKSTDCIIRAPDVDEPQISARRLAVGLQTVYDTLPCYTTVSQHLHHDRDDGDDVIDVEVPNVCESESPLALPSPAPDPEEEARQWERWTNMSRGTLKKS